MKRLLIFLIYIVGLPAMGDFGPYRGTRMMGMGGAGIAVVNDETALLVNPNGLSKLRSHFYTFLDPEATGNERGVGPLIGSAILDAADPDVIYNQLADRIGKAYYFKGQMFPSVVLNNFGLGLFGRAEMLSRRNSDGTYDIQTQRDWMGVVGFNFRLWGGRIKVGFNGKAIRRTEFFGTRDPAVQSLGLNTMGASGDAYGVDGGLTLTAPWQWLPAISAVVRDIGSTKFHGDSATGLPQTMNQRIDVGVALFPILSKYSRLTLTADYHDITDSQGLALTAAKRTFAGLELNLWDSWFVRSGYGADHWTAGLEYATGNFQFQIATFGQDIQFPGTPLQEERRWMLKFSFRR